MNSEIMKKSVRAILLLAIVLLWVSCENIDNQKPVGGVAVGEGPRKPLPEYTEDNAREWEPLKGEHLPQITLDTTGGSDTLRIYVPLNDPSPSHYIEKIGVMDTKGRTLVVKSFDRVHRKYDVTFPVQSEWDLKTTKVFVKCNLHDLWTVENMERFRKE